MKQIKLRISTPRGYKYVKAYQVNDEWAVNKDGRCNLDTGKWEESNYWRVSHIPTGRTVAIRTKTRRRAIQMLGQLVKILDGVNLKKRPPKGKFYKLTDNQTHELRMLRFEYNYT